ncbi:MAG TPA: hypothetical protein VKG23_07020 [Thermoanaerobaculia bacterium]|nr:hypothetical protein [Thermoanaerobaculia bacterium]
MPPRHVRGYRSALIVSALGIFRLAPPTFLAAQSITEFSVPSPTADLRGITLGPDGALWFNEAAANKIGRITLQGDVTEFPTPDATFGIATGPDGNLWFTTYDGIGRMTTSGAVTIFSPPSGTDPSEFSAFWIVNGPDGAMWFSVGQGSIGRITTDGSMTLFPIPNPSGSDRAVYDLAFGPDGNIWFGDFQSQSYDPTPTFLGRMTPSGVFSSFPGWAPFGFAIGPDGALWGSGDGVDLGRISSTGSVQTFPVTGFRGLATGSDGNLWVSVDGQTIGRVTPAGAVTSYTIQTPGTGPLGVGFGASPYAFLAGPDGNIWFTEEYGNKIGRVNLKGASLCTPDAHTLCLNGGRFAVTATFQQASGGPFAQATAVTLTDDTGYFWFFDPTNIEIVTKLLNGCAVNGNYWFFGAGLTNVAVSTIVQDLQSATMKTYTNNFGTSFPPVQDTSAFRTCP